MSQRVLQPEMIDLDFLDTWGSNSSGGDEAVVRLKIQGRSPLTLLLCKNVEELYS